MNAPAVAVRNGLGVWQGELAGAFLYGLLLAACDYLFCLWRYRLVRKAGWAGFARLIGLTFLLRVVLILAGIALAARFFGRSGLLLVCLLYLASIPVSLRAAGRLGRGKERAKR